MTEVQIQNALSLFFSHKKNGYIYLIKNNDSGLFKIGITKDLKRRFRQLETQSGCSLRLVFAGLFLDDDTPVNETEKVLHNKYKDRKKIGEWFNLTREDILQIRNYILSLDFEDIIEDLKYVQ